MTARYSLSFIFIVFALLPAACSPAAAAPAADVPTAVVEIPSPTPTLVPTAVPLSFTPATYTAEAEGFELDYPSDWTAVPISVVGSRGSSGAVYSPGTTA